MKKWKQITLAAFLCTWVVTSSQSTLDLRANEFEGNEDAWVKRCSVAQSSSEMASKCAKFKTYYAKQSTQLQNEVNSLKKQISALDDSIDKLAAAVKKQASLVKTIEKKIAMNEASIRLINSDIKKLNEKINALQRSIDERNAIIIKRMQDEQATIGTNMSLEIIMGSQDLLDMIRKIDGLNRINEQDQREIDKIKEEKQEQNLQKSEKVRLKTALEETKSNNENAKKEAEEVRKQKQVLLDKFRKQEEALDEKMRSVKVDISTIQENMINITNAPNGSFNFTTSGKLAKPVNGSISANSFYYPNGGVHLGLDVAVPLRTPIYAPANGIILYANNPVSTNSGYIGNTTGYPAGTGNSIQMLTRVDGTTYALSFFHMAQENFSVRAGQKVSKGQLLGLSGNTGNTTGPHCHLEVINLGNMGIDTAISRFQSTADFAWGNGWGSAGLANVCSVKGPPCREHPEDVYGYR